MFDDLRENCFVAEEKWFHLCFVGLRFDPHGPNSSQLDSEQFSFEPRTVPLMAGTVECEKAGDE